MSPLIYASQQVPSSSHGLETIVTGEWGRGRRAGERGACIPGHTGMWAHGVMSLHYNIGTHQSQPHTRSSDGVLVPHSAPRDAVVAPQHQTCSLRSTPPKLFWSSGPPRSPSPHSWHQRSDSEIGRCDGCNKIAASHLVSPSFSEQAHFLSHASVVLAQPACYFVARLLLPKRPTYT